MDNAPFRGDGLLARAEYRRADSWCEINRIFHLRNEWYLKEEAISKNRNEIYFDAFDAGDNVYNIGLYIDGEIASALRLHIVRTDANASPSLESFPDILTPKLAERKSVIDLSTFVFNHEIARKYPQLPYVALRPIFLASTFFAADMIITTCRTASIPFYRRSLYARVVSEPRLHPFLTTRMGLMEVDIHANCERILARYPYWQSSAREREALLGPGPTYQHGGAPYA